jgi:hypothetical protein
MTPSTKEVILYALASESANASDNLFRIRRQFANLSPFDLNKEYGQSGRTCRQLLTDAEVHSNEVELARAEVESMP